MPSEKFCSASPNSLGVIAVPTQTLFANQEHRNLLLEDFTRIQRVMVQANMHVVVHGPAALILDPGGQKIYAKVMAELSGALGTSKLQTIFLSHQDPDIVAGVNSWLMSTEATAYAASLWTRFIPHFGVDPSVQDRLRGIPDAGMVLDLAGCKLLAVPAHFLHSPGNFNLYDPVSKILYTGDLGASVDVDYAEVTDFDAHIAPMEEFHCRYLTSNKALRAWVQMVRGMDIEIMAPQHGAFFRGRAMIDRFLTWCEGLECGMERTAGLYRIPDSAGRQSRQ
jgi:flavorubredoxin